MSKHDTEENTSVKNLTWRIFSVKVFVVMKMDAAGTAALFNFTG